MDSTAEPNRAHVERRETCWAVVYGGTVVGRHTAQYRAREQADALNTDDEDDE